MEYSEYQQRYSLPSFEELDNEFEVSSIEETNFLLREIRRKMTDKVEFFVKIIEQLLHPDTTLGNLHECRNLDEQQKEKMFDALKELMIISRKSLLLYVEEDDSNDAVFIRESFEKWKTLKTDIKDIICILKNAWEKDIKSHETLRYFG